jgi:hypothetical protein
VQDTTSDQTAPVRWGDFGPFGIVPEWLIDAAVSDRAIRIYALLSRYAQYHGGETFRGKKELAERLRCSKPSIDRALRELIAVGAIEIQDRWANNGAQRENGYVVWAAAPSNRRHGGVTPETGEGHTSDTPSRARSSLEIPVEDPGRESTRDVAVIVTRRGWKVDRKVVTDDEEGRARWILICWNEHAGQALASKDWLAKIVMRIREHPELTAEDHEAIIAAALRPENAWWSGPPTPSVVYGNGAQFERAMVTTWAPPQGGDGAFDVAMAELQRIEEAK